MKAKNTKTIRNFFIAALIVFLALPIIFPEANPVKIIKKENLFQHEDSPLPIFPKDNILKKYVKRLKKFYKVEQEESLSPKEEVQEITDEEINAHDLFFSTDYEEENYDLLANANNISDRDNNINLQKGTVQTNDGLLLEPTQEGYYYQGKFYKNGTYPENANKQAIEGALSRYHNTIAKEQGKKALYYADDKGNLTVDYVKELPSTISSDIDGYYAKNTDINPAKTVDAFKDIAAYAKINNSNDYDKYRGATIIGLNNKSDFSNGNIKSSDIANASLSDMHSAYNLLQMNIQNGEIGKNINIEKPHNPGASFVKKFLNADSSSPVTITDKPNTSSNNVYQGNTEEIYNVALCDQNFAQEYADKIHQLSCDSSIESPKQFQDIPTFASDNFKVIDSKENILTCGEAPIIEQSANISGTVPEESDFNKFKRELNKVTTQNEKDNVNIISTDKNFFPVAAKLNEEGSIKNKEGNPVTVYVIGPKEGETDLSNILHNITFSVTDDTNVAAQLDTNLSNFYSLTQSKDTYTMLAFPTDDINTVFVLNDPNNSYWIQNPKQINKYPNQYMEKNGVYYPGAIVDKTEIIKMVSQHKTNLLFVSEQPSNTAFLPNGSVYKTIDGQNVNINSFDPEKIGENVKMVNKLSESWEEQKLQQDIAQDINKPLKIDYGVEAKPKKASQNSLSGKTKK